MNLCMPRTIFFWMSIQLKLMEADHNTIFCVWLNSLVTHGDEWLERTWHVTWFEELKASGDTNPQETFEWRTLRNTTRKVMGTSTSLRRSHRVTRESKAKHGRRCGGWQYAVFNFCRHVLSDLPLNVVFISLSHVLLRLLRTYVPTSAPIHSCGPVVQRGHTSSSSHSLDIDQSVLAHLFKTHVCKRNSAARVEDRQLTPPRRAFRSVFFGSDEIRMIFGRFRQKIRIRIFGPLELLNISDGHCYNVYRRRGFFVHKLEGVQNFSMTVVPSLNHCCFLIFEHQQGIRINNKRSISRTIAAAVLVAVLWWRQFCTRYRTVEANIKTRENSIASCLVASTLIQTTLVHFNKD